MNKKMNKKEKRWILGDFAWADQPSSLNLHENACLEVENAVVKALHPAVPEGVAAEEIVDYRGSLIVPPFVDTHLHAVQYVNRGLGLDRELLSWLETYTYPEEKRFASPDYARPVFVDLIHELWYRGSLRSCIFSSTDVEATLLLMRLLDEAGLSAYVGKVNINRHAVPGLQETTEESLAATRDWIERSRAHAPRILPILTPRFAPSCTAELLRGLGEIAAEFSLPVQSHVNENLKEIAWVRELFPEAKHYLDVYERYGLLPPQRSIQAHCVYNSADETRRLCQGDILIAHCPLSNSNIASGIMPCRELMEGGAWIGLGSDISGGETLSMHEVMKGSLRSSALLARQRDFAIQPLSWREAFYLATRGGARFFGHGGSFSPGSSFDALVVSTESFGDYRPLSLAEKLQKFIYLGEPQMIRARWLEGRYLPEPLFQS